MGWQHFGKAVDPTIVEGISAYVDVDYRVVIEPEVMAQIRLDAPIYERLMSLGPNVIRADKAAIFAVLTSADFSTGTGRKASFTVGGDPNSINPQRSTYALAKKSYGASGGIKDVDIIASAVPGAPITINNEQFTNDAERLIRLLTIRTVQGIDYGMIKGNSTTDTDDFDGLEIKVTSSNSGFYRDADGDTLVTGMVDEHVVWMMSKGVYPTAIYCNPIMHAGIVSAYQDRARAQIVINDGENRALGLWASSIITPAGELPIVSDPRFTVTSTGDSGAYSVQGDVFFAVEFYAGERILYPEWQIPISAINLAKVMGRGRATSTEFAVWSHLTLVERTNWWAQGRLANVVVSATREWTAAGE